jgi:adenine-specific DNA-methyltransferase
MLYLLILFGFNQQIRFNADMECNNPVGMAGYNDCILEKLVSFCRNLKEQNIVFKNELFQNLEPMIQNEDFVFCDPPYLVTLGSYNDGKRCFNGWDEDDEQRLLDFLDRLNQRGVHFMMSNTLEHKGVQNKLLAEWVKKRNFNVVEYAARGRNEVLVRNYRRFYSQPTFFN